MTLVGSQLGGCCSYNADSAERLTFVAIAAGVLSLRFNSVERENWHRRCIEPFVSKFLDWLVI
jgi:hypothetical protein